MGNGFKVSVAKDYLGFSSAHFITLSGHKCESLHGHNYRVGVTIEGALDPECAFVVDFALIKQVVKPLADAMDHKVLLPTKNPKLVLREEGESTIVEYLGRSRFVFPTTNLSLVPIANTTAEMIAEYLAHRVRDGLRAQGLSLLTAIEVEVEESPGQAGSFRLGL